MTDDAVDMTDYQVVKNRDPELYRKIVAFASTIDLPPNDQRVLPTRATIEAFCMSIVARVLMDGA